jgi:hypothetical protein
VAVLEIPSYRPGIAAMELMFPVVLLSENEFVIGNVVYYAAAPFGVRAGYWCPPSGILAWRQLARKKLRLDAVPSHEAVLYHRPGQGGVRQFTNGPEILATLQKTWPEWKARFYRYPLGIVAPEFAGLAFLFAAHGAGIANIIFQRPGTAYCEVLTTIREWCMVELALELGVVPFISIMNWNHWANNSPRPMPLEIADAVAIVPIVAMPIIREWLQA